MICVYIICVADAIGAMPRCPQVSLTLPMYSSLDCYFASLVCTSDIAKSYLSHYAYMYRESEVPGGVISLMGNP